jgi:hypothetical protein
MCLDGRAAALLVAAASMIPAVPTGAHSQISAAAAPKEAVSVTVTLIPPKDRLLTSAAVTIHREAGAGAADSPGPPVAIRGDGSFVFSNVAKGTYRIHARAAAADVHSPLVARYRIVVQTHDLTVPLTLRPGASLTGQVAFARSAGAPLPPLAGLRIQAVPSDDGADMISADVLRDGSFRMTGIAPGRHLLAIAGLPEPWVLDRVTYRGADISDSGVEADSDQSIADVRIAVTANTTEVSGTVRDSDGRAVSGATVLVIPAASEFWIRGGRRLGRTTTRDDGGYRYRGLPAGEYRVAAIHLQDEDIYAAELLRRLSAAGAPFTLAPLGAAAIDLGLTPAPAAAR